MPSKKQTSVVLTEQAEKIRQKNGKLFGMKTIFSAGMVWFDKLPLATKMFIVAAVKDDEDLDKEVEIAIRQMAEERNYRPPPLKFDTPAQQKEYEDHLKYVEKLGYEAGKKYAADEADKNKS